MDIHHLEHHLSRGSSFGYNTINDNTRLGWILLSKRFPVNKFFERFTEEDDPDIYREQLKIVNEPYQVWLAEIKKEVYDDDRDPSNEDYFINISYYFKSLDDAELFLKELQLDLADIKWSNDVIFW